MTTNCKLLGSQAGRCLNHGCRHEACEGYLCSVCWSLLPRWLRLQLETPMETREAAEMGLAALGERTLELRRYASHAECN